MRWLVVATAALAVTCAALIPGLAGSRKQRVEPLATATICSGYAPLRSLTCNDGSIITLRVVKAARLSAYGR